MRGARAKPETCLEKLLQVTYLHLLPVNQESDPYEKTATKYKKDPQRCLAFLLAQVRVIPVPIQGTPHSQRLI